jgi:tetratricopeptide (TPR) repeat protein
MRLLFAMVLMMVVTAVQASPGGGGGSKSGGSSGGGSNSAVSDPSAYEKSQKIQGLYQKGVEAGKDGDYSKAISYFQDALAEDPENPDALNMLAHAQRKIGLINEAIENYWKALKYRPNFPEAREYLGEAYIQAALQEIKALKDAGKEGEEQLEDLTKDFKEAAKNLK